MAKDEKFCGCQLLLTSIYRSNCVSHHILVNLTSIICSLNMVPNEIDIPSILHETERSIAIAY